MTAKETTVVEGNPAQAFRAPDPARNG